MEREQQRKAHNVRHQRGPVELDRRYGEIGISAVAAAVRYHGERQDEQSAQPDFALSFDRD